MLKSIWITDKTKNSWDDFVLNHPMGNLGNLSIWLNIIEESFHHISGKILAIVNEREEIVAGMAIYTINSRLTGNKIVCSPFSTLFDPLITDKNQFQIIFNELKKLYEKENLKYIEIKTFNTTPILKKFLLSSASHYKHHSLLIIDDLEGLKKKFHRTCIRQPLNRAIRSGILCREAETINDLSIFYNLLTDTRRRLGLPIIPFIYFRSIWNNLAGSKKVIILIAEKDNTPIGAMLLFHFKDTLLGDFLGWNRNYERMSPSIFLYWEAIKYAQSKQAKIFDFGRTFTSNKNLMSFKDRWNTEVGSLVDFYYPRTDSSPHTPRENSFPYKVFTSLSKQLPMPLFRTLSHFLYQHLV